MKEQLVVISRAHAEARKKTLPTLRRFNARRQQLVCDALSYNTDLLESNLPELVNGVNALSEGKGLLGGSPQRKCVAPALAVLNWARVPTVLTSNLRRARVLQIGQKFQPSALTLSNSRGAFDALLGLDGQAADCALLGGFLVVRVYRPETATVQDLAGKPTEVRSRAVMVQSMEYPHTFLFTLYGEALEKHEPKLFSRGTRFHKVTGGRVSRGHKNVNGTRVPWEHIRYNLTNSEALEILSKYDVPSYTPTQEPLEPLAAGTVYKPKLEMTTACITDLYAGGSPAAAKDTPANVCSKPTMHAAGIRAPARPRVFGGDAAKNAPRMVTTLTGTQILRSAPPKQRFGPKRRFRRSPAPSTAESVSTTTRKLFFADNGKADEPLKQAIQLSLQMYENERKADIPKERPRSPSEDSKEDLPELTNAEMENLRKAARSSSPEGPPDDKDMDTDPPGDKGEIALPSAGPNVRGNVTLSSPKVVKSDKVSAASGMNFDVEMSAGPNATNKPLTDAKEAKKRIAPLQAKKPATPTPTIPKYRTPKVKRKRASKAASARKRARDDEDWLP